MDSIPKLFELAAFPSFCKLCDSLLQKKKERVICSSCLEKLISWRSGYCIECGRFFSSSVEPHVCSRCLEEASNLLKHRSVGLYSGVLKDAILLFKYKGYKCLGENLAQFVLRFLGEEEGLWGGIDLIVPVPLHRKKLGKRGFNQSLILARILAAQKNIPCDEKVLKKVRQGPPQTSLEAEDRLRNLKDVFMVKRSDRTSGKRVLLIDDVFTTGATLNECARMLLESGAMEVRALTVAQAAPV